MFACCAIVASFATGAGAESQEPSIINSATVNQQIGSPPPLNPSDYVPYARKGENLLAFPWRSDFTDGAYFPCTERHDSALLYPSTPYTRWLIQRFLLDTLGHTETQGRTYPGDYGFAVRAPDYLQPWPANSAVRGASCVRGWVAFAGIPPGDYIAVGEIGEVDQGGTPGMRRCRTSC